MLSIQHILCGFLALDDNELTDEYVAASIFPDAIRAYTGNREYTHFERNSDETDISWFSFPDSMDHQADFITEHMQGNAHLADDSLHAVIGNETVIEEYEQHNQHLSDDMFIGIRDHLIEDRRFDDFIRDEIDCSRKYDDVFAFHGEQYDGAGVRALINEIEQYGIYTLAHAMYEKNKTTTNQEWLASRIKPVLDKMYCQDLSDRTFSFMHISPEVDELITTHDWSHIGDAAIPQDRYLQMYSDVVKQIRNRTR